MPSTTASRSKSIENTYRPPRPLTEARPSPGRWLLAIGFERSDQVASLQVVRKQDHLRARFAELVHVLVFHAAELRFQRRALLPLAVFSVGNRTDDGLHRVLAQIFRDPLLVERLGCVDRL